MNFNHNSVSKTNTFTKQIKHQKLCSKFNLLKVEEKQ